MNARDEAELVLLTRNRQKLILQMARIDQRIEELIALDVPLCLKCGDICVRLIERMRELRLCSTCWGAGYRVVDGEPRLVAENLETP